jgi:hypothetical protein
LSLQDAQLALASERDALAAQLSSSEGAFTERVATLERELVAAQSQIAQLRSDLETSTLRFRDNEERIERDMERLLLRAEDLQSIARRLETENIEKGTQLQHLNDVNHVLAVRLKSAEAQQEAAQLEAETRRMLLAQNEELERQLQDLRKVVAAVMSRPPRP